MTKVVWKDLRTTEKYILNTRYAGMYRRFIFDGTGLSTKVFTVRLFRILNGAVVNEYLIAFGFHVLAFKLENKK